MVINILMCRPNNGTHQLFASTVDNSKTTTVDNSQRPTQIHEGQHRPTQANDRCQQPTQANEVCLFFSFFLFTYFFFCTYIYLDYDYGQRGHMTAVCRHCRPTTTNDGGRHTHRRSEGQRGPQGRRQLD